MRNKFFLLALLVVATSLATGCANIERKFGRGMSNTFEVLRGGELHRSMEQTGLFESPDSAYGYGFVRGVSRTIGRTTLGVFEMATCPIPPYGPIFTGTFSPGPVYPDNYAPGLLESSMFATDTHLGYSGGDIAPMFPGSRFRVFDTH